MKKYIVLILFVVSCLLAFSDMKISGTTDLHYTYTLENGFTSDPGLFLDKIGLKTYDTDYFIKVYLTNKEKSSMPNEFYIDELYAKYQINKATFYLGKKRYRNFGFQLGHYSLSEAMHHSGDTIVSDQKNFGVGYKLDVGDIYVFTNPSSPMYASALANLNFEEKYYVSVYLKNMHKKIDNIYGKTSIRAKAIFENFELSTAVGYDFYNEELKSGTITALLAGAKTSFNNVNITVETDASKKDSPVFLGDVEYLINDDSKLGIDIIYKHGDINGDGFIDEDDDPISGNVWYETKLTKNINAISNLCYKSKNFVFDFKLKWLF